MPIFFIYVRKISCNYKYVNRQLIKTIRVHLSFEKSAICKYYLYLYWARFCRNDQWTNSAYPQSSGGGDSEIFDGHPPICPLVSFGRREQTYAGRSKLKYMVLIFFCIYCVFPFGAPRVYIPIRVIYQK